MPPRASSVAARAMAARRARKGDYEDEDEGPSQYQLQGQSDVSHAQKVVRELYFRYEKQLQRYTDYRNLFAFLTFVALFLAVLYCQRSANTAYQVHSTIDSVVTPVDDEYQSTDNVYQWLTNVLQTVWVDPVCGDGICEAPFEFASYSHFGCRADCGKLSDIQNLTKIQVDLYYDFSHPVGSIPASDLMQQASWNLCPTEDTGYGSACYFPSDITFTSLSGEQHYVIDDTPDGNWDLQVKRDIFDKVAGAVRDTSLVYASGFYYKVYIAAASAMAEQDFELNLLNSAITIAKTPYLTYVKSQMDTYFSAADSTYEYNQLRSAFCNCGVSTGDSALAAFSQSVDPADPTFMTVFSMTWAAYSANPTYCTGGTTITARTNYSDPTTEGTVPGPLISAWCATTLASALQWQANMTGAVQSLLIDQRLGISGQTTTGKISARYTVNNALYTALQTNNPELLDPVFNVPRGISGYADPILARVDILQQLYVDGLAMSTAPQPAYLNLLRTFVYGSSVNMVQLWTRSAARAAEVAFQKADAASIALPAYNALFKPTTVGALVAKFKAAGASSTVLPSPDTTGLGTMGTSNGFAINYNLAIWSGNVTAYLIASLDTRGPTYIGTCIPMNASCAPTQTDTHPYTCTDLNDPMNSTIPGTLSNSSYRATCEAPCDRKYDCDTICECYGTCGTNTPFQTCSCPACMALNGNAAADVEFLDIQSVVASQAAASVSIAALPSSFAGRRKLQQTPDVSAQLTSVLSEVGAVKTQQDTISAQMANLKLQVDRSNQLAEARAADHRLLDLIQAGRQDIQTGQTAVSAKLDLIIGKQNQALAAAQAAADALAAIRDLSQKQVEAQSLLEQAVQNQLTAIKTATYQNVISLTAALALWKRARRDKAYTLKAAQLANTPCTSLPLADNTFILDNGNIIDTTTAREREIGLTNRVIGGMLLHQTRSNATLCGPSKFDTIEKTCTGPPTVAAYGIDPVFKAGTNSYNGDLDDLDGTIVCQYYNCSTLSVSTYNLRFLNSTVNVPPYCAELYNPQKLPYAFHYYPLKDKDAGFPVWLDINLGQDMMNTWLTWVQEGLYLDPHTRTMTAELVTYNAPLRMFGYFQVRFEFSDGGTIHIKHRLHTVKLEVYHDPEDWARFAAEIVLSIWVCIMLVLNVVEVVRAQRTRRNGALLYFAGGWNFVETVSNCLLFACMVIWWVWVTCYAKKYDVAIRYNVYATLAPTANFLALNDDGVQLTAANYHIYRLKELIDLLNWYFALNGMNILLLIARVLKRMDFQPRLGVVTRSLWLAGPDLIHFAIVAGMVFVGYAMMAHLIFGNAIESFQTFGDSINTCFEILLGNIDVNKELRALGGLQSAAGALFFWSYELLVFMVLLNFLLAIIVDAFSEVKDKTHETVSIHTELLTMARDEWHSLKGRVAGSHVSDSKLGNLLKAWAGEGQRAENKEAELDEAQKLLTVLNEDLDEETLREVLMECLKDAPAGGLQAPGSKSGGLARFFSRAPPQPEATAAEVAVAAKYIIDRFGAKPESLDELSREDEATDSPTAAGVNASATTSVAASGGGNGLTGGNNGYNGGGSLKDPAMERERDQLAAALERLADVQRELADGQRNLMAGQRQLAEQQSKLVSLMVEPAPQSPGGA